MKIAERFEDMSPRGRLRVLQQDDGDMIVCVIEDMDSGGCCAGLTASVEFCTSGGKSPKTLAALRALMLAMAEENAADPHNQRRGEIGLGVEAGPVPAPQQLDYRALIDAAYSRHGYEQGTHKCVAFKHGAEWALGIQQR